MKNKGFTLIELLGVMIILALLLILVFPSVINMIKKSNTEKDDLTRDLIINAANLYVKDNIDDFIETNGNMYPISVKDLVYDGYIKSPIELSDREGDLTNKLCVQVLYNNKFTYEIKNEGECIENFIMKPDLMNETLTPVVYDDENWVIVDEDDDWYNYEEQEWANAVILDSSVEKEVGDTVTVDGANPDVLGMFVWIPRFSYTIKEVYGVQGFGGGDLSAATPGAIDIKFLSQKKKEMGIATYSGENPEEWRTHPAFTFGDYELSGMWVGKFESAHETLSAISTDSNPNLLNCTDENCESADGLRVLPSINLISLRSNDIANSFYAVRSMGRNGNPFGINANITDSHMMKNSEWGAAAYLSQSKYGKYGNPDYTGIYKEVYQNNANNYYLGRSAGAPPSVNTAADVYTIEGTYTFSDSYPSSSKGSPFGFYTYDGYLLKFPTNEVTTIRNLKTVATTTGNMTGIYDMCGGAWDFVMGVAADSTGEPIVGKDSGKNSGFYGLLSDGTINESGLTMPDIKYYDLYTTSVAETACNGGICYGHALSETLHWNGAIVAFVTANDSWVYRGAGLNPTIFTAAGEAGQASENDTFRIVLVPTK